MVEGECPHTFFSEHQHLFPVVPDDTCCHMQLLRVKRCIQNLISERSVISLCGHSKHSDLKISEHLFQATNHMVVICRMFRRNGCRNKTDALSVFLAQMKQALLMLKKNVTWTDARSASQCHVSALAPEKNQYIDTQQFWMLVSIVRCL